MNKKILSLVATIIASSLLFGAQVVAAAPPNIGINAAYSKGSGNYDVVVKDAPGTKLVLYVNDKNPSKATVNKSDWATFHKVKLTPNSKVSFTKQLNANNKTYEKPINYVRYYVVANGKTSFSATNPAATVAPTPTPAPAAPTPSPQASPTPTNCTNGTYVNSAGNTVCSPEASPTVPAGATARCVDGTYSFSQSRSGTCSHHGGVASWL